MISLFKQLIHSSGILSVNFESWPKKSSSNFQEIEISLDRDYLHLSTPKLISLDQIVRFSEAKQLDVFYFFAQDLKSLVNNLVNMHFKVNLSGKTYLESNILQHRNILLKIKEQSASTNISIPNCR